MRISKPPGPPRKPMPLVGYFAVVGSTLLGLIFVADATMTRPERPSFTSNFDGLPAAYKGTTVRPAAPQLASLPVPAATTDGRAPAKELVTPQAAPAPPAPVSEPAKPVRPKAAHKARRHDDDGFEAMFRQASGGREPASREPSWRDSWASGAFQQRGPRQRRSASRSRNDDFWPFR